jgi:hypothetical protein
MQGNNCATSPSWRIRGSGVVLEFSPAAADRRTGEECMMLVSYNERVVVVN